MTFAQIIARLETERAALAARGAALSTEGRSLIALTEGSGARAWTSAETARANEIVEERAKVKTNLSQIDAQLAEVRAEQVDDDRLTQLAGQSHPTGATPPTARGDEVIHQDAAHPGDWINADTGERAAVRSDESLRSHPAFERMQRHGDEAVIGHYGSLGQMLRALTTTGASAIVPTLWAGEFIDRVRNKAQVIQAGASVIPMAAKTINIGRLTGDPTVAFRAEAGTITSSDPTFDNVTLTAKSLDGFVKVSREWMQDSENGDDIVVNALADALALQIDLTALYGGVTSGAGSINLPTPPNPRGVLATLQAVLTGNVLGGATNGTALTSSKVYDEIIDTIFKVRAANEDPNAILWSSKLAQQFAKAYDTTGQPIRMPQAVEELQRYVTNQIPSYTQGTMANVATDAFVGDWDKLLIGERLQLEIEINTQLYAETGQVGIFIHWRGDFAVARPAAFAVYRSLGGAA
ncbi:phage major capsid protein [Microbacterium sp. CJ88]|uniref:phage major capsid protein n=1 Tax=Microbacterium sp. CJ88 TaxID=3445672 RepID=UPI003F65CE3A